MLLVKRLRGIVARDSDSSDPLVRINEVSRRIGKGTRRIDAGQLRIADPEPRIGTV